MLCARPRRYSQQQRVAYADLLGIERLDRWRGKLREADAGCLCFQFAYVKMGAGQKLANIGVELESDFGD
jgi:hypothetical protein